jgi:hypothetical protein
MNFGLVPPGRQLAIPTICAASLNVAVLERVLWRGR